MIRRLSSEPSVAHAGAVYRTEGARLEPEHAVPIPIWFGTFGPRALELTGRCADG